MSATPDSGARAGRRKPSRGQARSTAVLGQASPKVLSPYEAREGDWRIVALQDVGRIVTGSTPPKARQDYYGGSFPFVKPGELLHCLVSESFDHLSDEGSEMADVAPAGSVLVSCIGNLGKTGLATRPVAFNQQINAIIPHVPEHSKWIFYAVQAPDFAAQISAISSATTIAIVNKGKFSTLRIPFAPLPEQRRIVAEIEKQFTRLEAGVVALRRVQANLKRYRAAVLKAACEGRLVPTEASLARSRPPAKNGQPAYESGEALLARILTERRQNWHSRGKYNEPAAPDTSGLPQIPDNWTLASLEQIAWSSSYGTSAKCSPDNSGPPVLRIPNIAGGRVDLTDLKFAGTDEPIEVGNELAPGDLLIIRTNGSKNLIGRSAVVRTKLERATSYASYLIRFRLFGSPMLFDWVGTIWDVSFLRSWIEQRAATSAGQHNISMSVLSTMPIPLPPLAEQTRIVAEVERRLSVVEELESVVTANLLRATRLRQSILQAAFTGDIV